MSGFLTARQPSRDVPGPVAVPAERAHDNSAVQDEVRAHTPLAANPHRQGDLSHILGQSHNDDVALAPIREALNDTSMTPGERTQRMLDYRNHQLADVPLGMMHAIQSGQEGMPIVARGDDKGMHVPLYERLAGDENDAEAISGFVGAQYELMDHSLSENAGNSGLKDILVNAEGARFGTSLMSEPDTLLPGQYDGPVPEDRSIVHPRSGQVR